MDPKTGLAPVGDPPVDPVVTPPATPPVVPPAPPPATPPEKPALTLEELTKMVADLRKEAGDNRVKAKDAQDKLDALESAKLTDEQRTQAELKKLREETVPALELKNRTLTVQVAAVALDIVDPDAAAKLIDWDAVNAGATVEDALKALVVAKPYLLKTPAQAAPVSSAVVPPSVTSPAAATSAGVPLSFTKEALGKMTPAEYETNRSAIHDALRAGRVS